MFFGYEILRSAQDDRFLPHIVRAPNRQVGSVCPKSLAGRHPYAAADLLQND